MTHNNDFPNTLGGGVAGAGDNPLTFWVRGRPLPPLPPSHTLMYKFQSMQVNNIMPKDIESLKKAWLVKIHLEATY